ncbi:MAG: alkaline phosphatase D family protein, partial [Planctomycetes bacterium]|nr:alkaline phosphatase D family protein [Planctomycetota bacterium]
MRHRLASACLVSIALLLAAAPLAAEGPPFLATGVRVGEVSADGAIVWIRLTAAAERNRAGATQKDAVDRGGTVRDLPEGLRATDLEGACPAAAGEARVVYSREPGFRDAATTPWRGADVARDGVVQVVLGGLLPAALYRYRVETRAPGGAPGATFEGSFRTAPKAEAAEDVTFTVVTGMMVRDLDDPEGFHIYRSMAELQPDFFVATGDTVYYDNEWPAARGVELARYHWNRMYSLPRIVEFHRAVPGYWIKDDHDTLDNDCWPGKVSSIVSPLTFEEGQRIFLEQVPMGKTTSRTVRWGKHLQVWLVEGRDFRSPNTDPDG